ncbi:hypothetical protein BDR26DRAFT_1007842 [Obelidium mucronatum]|nr:hypothetical protein BDR26DRAFT_1007842 [Obelidium mucronatum]
MMVAASNAAYAEKNAAKFPLKNKSTTPSLLKDTNKSSPKRKLKKWSSGFLNVVMNDEDVADDGDTGNNTDQDPDRQDTHFRLTILANLAAKKRPVFGIFRRENTLDKILARQAEANAVRFVEGFACMFPDCGRKFPTSQRRSRHVNLTHGRLALKHGCVMSEHGSDIDV